MEPNANLPNTNPEVIPSLPAPYLENAPHATEQELAGAIESERAIHEGDPTASNNAQVPLVSLSVVADPVSHIADDNASAILTNVPQVAADDDLIEKEWVDKARKIIAETTDDPYRREEAISLLQKEYLKKRYGKELGEDN